MKNIYGKELDILWNNYNFMIESIGFFDMLENSATELQQKFKLSYNSLKNQVEKANAGESKGRRSYAMLRLKRLLNIWESNGIVNVEGGIVFKGDDVYGSFPKFTQDNPSIMPSLKMIKKMQTKVLMKHVAENNINNRKELRESLMKSKISSTRATYLERLYGDIMARKELNDFMQKVEGESFVSNGQNDKEIIF